MNHLPPPADIAGVGEPTPTVRDGSLQPLLDLRSVDLRAQRLRVHGGLQHEDRPLPGPQLELCGSRAPVLHVEGDGALQPEREHRRVKQDALRPADGLVRGPRVVEGWPAIEPEAERATNDADTPDDARGPVGARSLMNGHEVHDLAHPIRVKKARDQDVCVGQIGLTGAELVDGGRDLKVPAPSVVQQGAEHAGRIEVRQATPVDGSVGGDQRHGPEISDDPVLLDG